MIALTAMCSLLLTRKEAAAKYVRRRILGYLRNPVGRYGAKGP
jgi:hypothetical protein